MKLYVITQNDFPGTWFLTKFSADRFMAKYKKSEPVFDELVKIREVKRLSDKNALVKLLYSDNYLKNLTLKNSGKRQELSARGVGV